MMIFLDLKNEKYVKTELLRPVDPNLCRKV